MWEKGYRYRKNYKNLSGGPDIVLNTDGCVKVVEEDVFDLNIVASEEFMEDEDEQ